jgi:predicted nucleic acid-binding protein
MRRQATFDSSFWIHSVFLDLEPFLLTDFELICPRAVERELGQQNPTSLRLKALLNNHTMQLVSPRSEKVKLYGDGERAAINLALEKTFLLLIDDWRPYEMAYEVGVKVVNTPAYLVQLFQQGRIPLERVLGDLGKLARRGTIKPTWIHAALKVVAEIRKKGPVE